VIHLADNIGPETAAGQSEAPCCPGGAGGFGAVGQGGQVPQPATGAVSAFGMAPEMRRNVIIGAAVAAVALVLFGILVGRLSASTSEPASPAPQPVAATSTTYVPVTKVDTPKERDRVAMETAARSFITAYKRPVPVEERRQLLAPYTAPVALEQAANIALEDIPTGDLVAAPESAVVDGDKGSVFQRLSDGHAFDLYLTNSDGRWLVYELHG
jgi:hypothetical protein